MFWTKKRVFRPRCVAWTLSWLFLIIDCLFLQTNQAHATVHASGTMLRGATGLQVCGTPLQSGPGEQPSTLERRSRRHPSRAEWHFLLRRRGEDRWCVINGKRMVRMIGPRSPAAARADASIGARVSVEERTPSRPRRLLRLSRTLLARAPVALQLGRCVGLAVGFDGSRTLPSNAPAAFRMQKLPRSFTFLRALSDELLHRVGFAQRKEEGRRGKEPLERSGNNPRETTTDVCNSSSDN